MKVVGFAGYSGAGKTTLVERLIPVLKQRGLRVSVVKHAHHRFDIDHPGKDTFRHREAGAFEVVVASTAAQAPPYYPFFFPDGRHFLYLRERNVFLGSLDDSTHSRLIEDAGNAMFASGHLVYMRETTLVAQAFDAGILTLSGGAFPLAERIQINTGSGAGAFSVSELGVLIYQVAGIAPSLINRCMYHKIVCVRPTANDGTSNRPPRAITCFTASSNCTPTWSIGACFPFP